jgi:hypothetical protein
MAKERATQSSRRVTLSAAALVLICFFLPWVQVSCIGMKDSVSGFDLARGDRSLWLMPLLMFMVLLLGSLKFIVERTPALFALGGMVGGGVSAWLMYRQRSNIGSSNNLIATFWTAWFWLGFIASLVVAGSALWFYAKRAREP